MQFPSCVLLFGPAIVLIVWALYLVAHDQNMEEEVLIGFLLVLAASVIAAEVVRIQKRRKILRRMKKGNNVGPYA